MSDRRSFLLDSAAALAGVLWARRAQGSLASVQEVAPTLSKELAAPKNLAYLGGYW